MSTEMIELNHVNPQYIKLVIDVVGLKREITMVCGMFLTVFFPSIVHSIRFVLNCDFDFFLLNFSFAFNINFYETFKAIYMYKNKDERVSK